MKTHLCTWSLHAVHSLDPALLSVQPQYVFPDWKPDFCPQNSDPLVWQETLELAPWAGPPLSVSNWFSASAAGPSDHFLFSFRVPLKSCPLSAPQGHPSEPLIPAGSHVCVLPAAMLRSGLPINPQVLGAMTPLLTFPRCPRSLLHLPGPMCMLLPALCIPSPQPQVQASH